MKRWNNHLVAAMSFVIVSAVYHLGLSVADISVEEAKEAGLLFAGMADSGVWPAFELGDLALVDWGSLGRGGSEPPRRDPGDAGQAGDESTQSCKWTRTGKIDTDREFRVAGLSGLVAAAGGSTPGCQSFGYSRFSHMLGADSRLTGIVAAGVVSLCALFGGPPRGIDASAAHQAGVLLFVGVGLVGSWLFSVRAKLPWADLWRCPADMRHHRCLRIHRGRRCRTARHDGAARHPTRTHGSDRSRVHRA